MKHVILFLFSMLVMLPLYTQNITPDPSFGNQGYVRTSVRPDATYGTLIDRTVDNRILLVGGSNATDAGYDKIVRYSTLGDSVSSQFLPYTPQDYPVVTAVKSLPNGSVLVANSSVESELIKILPNGSLDSTFGINGRTSMFFTKVQEIIIGQDNRILATGLLLNDYMGFQRGGYVLAYDMNGKPDSTFGENGKFRFSQGYIDFFFRIVQQLDGKLLVAGFSIFANERYNSLIRLTENGALDPTFGSGGAVFQQFTGGGENYGLALQPDHKILISGYSWDPYQAVVARYMPDGSPDLSFGENGAVYLPEVHEATDMMLFPNGKILTYCWLNNEENRSALIQLLADGSRDPAFGTNGVYFSPFLDFEPPMKMKLVDKNRIVGTGAVRKYMNNFVNLNLQLQGFLLSLNVGVLTPEEKPTVWAYPNPVRSSCELGFSLLSSETVSLELLDMNGKIVQQLLPATRFEPGDNRIPVVLDETLPPAVYVFRLLVSGKPSVSVRVVKG